VLCAVAFLPVSPASADPATYANLAAAFNNVGVSTPQTLTTSDFDGSGKSYSEQLLQYQDSLPGQTGTPLTPGQTFTHEGLTFTWPAAAGTGQSDNALAQGQTIVVSGQGTTLGIVGASSYGETFGEGTINYTDGTSDPLALDFPDWWNSSGSGDVVASTANFVANPQDATDYENHSTVDVYADLVPIDPNKTVASVTLPEVSDGPLAQVGEMHIFALSIGSPPAS
jgi:hypothetical protein